MHPGLGLALGSGLGVPVCGGCIGGGVRLRGMETVFPKLECEPPVGAAPVFPDTVLRRALGLPLQRVRFGWGLQGMFGLSSEENVGEQMPCHPPPPP